MSKILSRAVAFGLITLIAPMQALADDGESATAAIEKGKRHFEAKQYDEAIAEFTTAIRLDPNLPSAYYYRGLARYQKSNPTTFADAVKKDPKTAENWGWNYMEMHIPIRGPIEEEKAKRDICPPSEGEVRRIWDRIQDGKPEKDKQIFLHTHSELIANYFDSRRLIPLIGYAAIHRIHYKCWIYYTERTNADTISEAADIIYSDRDRFHLEKNPELDVAIADYTSAIKLDGPFARAYCGRGLAYGYKGEYEKAVAECTEAIKLDSKLAEAYCARGVVYYLKGESEKAVADYTEAICLDPNCAETCYKRGVAKLSTGDIEGAIVDLTESIRLDPTFADAYCARGRAYQYRKPEHRDYILDHKQTAADEKRFQELADNIK